MEDAIQYAKKYLEDLLSFFGLNTEVHATSEDDVIELEVPSTHLNGFLIGQRGDNMRAMQFLVSNALKNQGFEYSRVNVDIAEYKKQRADRLKERAEDWVRRVRETGEPMDLQPMNAADRRTVHKLAQDNDLVSESVGEGPDRHIVLKLGSATKLESKKDQPIADNEPIAAEAEIETSSEAKPEEA